MNTNKNYKFSSGWFSGFVQADGCFTITFDKKKTGLLIKPKPIFVLTQDLSEEIMFKELRKYLGIGYTVKNKDNIYLYITSLHDLNTVLFPILDKYTLRYGKQIAYLIFKSIVKKMLDKEHLKLKGLIEIVYFSFQLNINTSKRTEQSKQKLLQFLAKKHGELPSPSLKKMPYTFNANTNLSLDFVTGLIDGDGSFNVSFQIKPYRRVRVNFTVVQETLCKELLNELKTFFNCGNVYDLPSAASRFQVENIDLILNNIKPILDKTTFNTQKAEYYKIAIKISEIINIKGYKSDDIFKEIIGLAYNSNKLGKRRIISKEELIKKISN